MSQRTEKYLIKDLFDKFFNWTGKKMYRGQYQDQVQLNVFIDPK